MVLKTKHKRSEAKKYYSKQNDDIWTEVTKIRKSKSNINFKSDLSPLYTIKKMMHSLKLKFSLQQQQPK